MRKTPAASPDITDVARAAGVSAATVSRAFNHPELLRPDTRERIMRAVEATGYIRNRAAQAIHGRRSGTIGLIVPTIDNSIFSNLIQSFSESLQAQGFTLLIATHGYDLPSEYALLRNFLEHRVDGVALVGLAHEDRTYDLLASRGTSVVTMWNYSETSRISCVGADNYHVGRLAAEHVLALGHRRIALMFPPVTGNDRAEERLRGVTDTLAMANATPPAHWRPEVKYGIKISREQGIHLLAGADMPTAIIAGNDIVARGAASAASHLGLRIPDDISIMGIGDFSGSAEWSPPLSTVQIDAHDVGAEGAATLMETINGDPASPIVRVLTDARVVPRQSTGKMIITEA
ncbi:MAG: LacI family DNA-binding transcriptional regulator [Pikeienuella sp.]